VNPRPSNQKANAAMQTPPHLRILQPHPGIFAYYDGRVSGYRFDPRDNWVDDGALSLGVASYALVHADRAIVYDTGTTLAHCAAIKAHLDGLGVRSLRIVYSHWHKDHVAGTASFGNQEIIANTLTAAHLITRQAEIEEGHEWPPINPLIQPTTTFTNHHTLTLGPLRLELITLNIHSDDATVIWLPDQRILLAGDTLEDPITYVAEPEAFDAHLRDLSRLAALNPKHILPCHGAPDIIAKGGFGPGLIAATQTYVTWLTRLRHHPERQNMPVQDILASHLATDDVIWFPPYAPVHANNIQAALREFGHV
jgi:cyclase